MNIVGKIDKLTIYRGGPLLHARVLGPTSLWLLCPIINIAFYRTNEIWGLMLLITACAISTAHWKSPRRGSRLHVCDRVAAMALFTYLITRGGFKVVFPYLCAAAYALAQLDVKNVFWHLMFRFLGYWWVHYVMLEWQSAKSAVFVASNVFLYWTHAIFLIRKQSGSYLQHCTLVSAFAFVFSLGVPK